MKMYLFPARGYGRFLIPVAFFCYGFSLTAGSGICAAKGEIPVNKRDSGQVYFAGDISRCEPDDGVQPGRNSSFDRCSEAGIPNAEARPCFLPEERGEPNKVYVGHSDAGAVLYRNGRPFFIKGIGGSFRLARARAYGANTFRTWHGNVPEQVKKDLDLAAANGMFLMNGYWLSQRAADYLNEDYKARTRREVELLAETFRDHPNLLIWCLGNEIEIGADTPEAWRFVEELARIIKEKDKNHPVATVISYREEAAAHLVRYAPSIDILGINAYAAVPVVDRLVAGSGFTGPYMVTEWGPNGTWEVGKTLWGAPIEQTSEEKRKVYEERYACMQKRNCIGSFVFLWGQKQETTPSWFGMFAEKEVPGLPLNGEGYPTTEAMKKMWSGDYPEWRAPVVNGIRLDGKRAAENVEIPCSQEVSAFVDVENHPSGVPVRYVWEILKEATVKGIGGSYEPRPDRIGEVVTGEETRFSFSVDRPGYYRLFVYVVDKNGMAGTANIPFRVFLSKRGQCGDFSVS